MARNEDQDGTRPEYSEDGVDLSLIRRFLSLTPAERLEIADQHNKDLREFRALNGGR
jgi:hypothetical protein